MAYKVERRIRQGTPQVGVAPYRQIHAHSTGNPRSTIQNEADYYHNKDMYLGTFSHLVGNGRVIQVGEVGRGFWDVGGGWNAESYAAVEMIESHATRADFDRDYKIYCELLYDLAKQGGIPLTVDDGNLAGIKTHNYCTYHQPNNNSDHVDPIPYLAKWGITLAQFRSDVINAKASNSSSPKIVKNKFSKYSTENIIDKGKYANAPKGLGVQVHMSGKGWRKWVGSGELAGSTGKSTTLEAVIVTINGDLKAVEGAIHVASIGWVPCAGTFGTTGKELQIEAIKLKLAKKYDQGKTDLMYRVHQSDIGWSAWKKNGEQAGATGKVKGIEAIEVKLMDRK